MQIWNSTWLKILWYIPIYIFRLSPKIDGLWVDFSQDIVWLEATKYDPIDYTESRF